MPMPTAPPAGMVFETAVLDCVATAACGNVRPGMVATMTNQYVARFHNAATSSVSSSSHVMARISDQTAEMLVNCGRKYQKTATTIASEIKPGTTRRARLMVGLAGVGGRGPAPAGEARPD